MSGVRAPFVHVRWRMSGIRRWDIACGLCEGLRWTRFGGWLGWHYSWEAAQDFAHCHAVGHQGGTR